MIRRIVAVGLLVVAAAAPAQARQDAATCKMVTDARADVATYGGTVNTTTIAPSIDVISADTASSSTHMRAVVRLATLADPEFPAGGAGTTRAYTVEFPDQPGTTWAFHGTADGTPAATAIGGYVSLRSSGIAPSVLAEVLVDRRRAEVSITARTTDLENLGNLPRVVGPLDVTAARRGAVRFAVSASMDVLQDRAHGTKLYCRGQPSCVRVPN